MYKICSPGIGLVIIKVKSSSIQHVMKFFASMGMMSKKLPSSY